jgi:TPR repeat protein
VSSGVWATVAVLVMTLVAGCRAGGSGGMSIDEAARTCDGGPSSACEKAIGLLGERCSDRDPASCTKVAGLYLRGRTGRIEKGKALAAYGLGCEAGDVKACNAAGEGYFNQDRPKAEAYRQKACDLGSGEGCLYMSGYVHERGADAAAQSETLYRRGLELHVQACERGDASACYGAGGAISRDDEGRAGHYYREAVQLWRKQCDVGDSYACYRLGIAYASEKGVSFDAERTRQLLGGACDKDVVEACAELGRVFKEMTSEPGRAAPAFEKACLAGVEKQLPCRAAGFAYVDGDGVPADKPRAARLLDVGCTLGDEWCCFKLGTMLMTGDGIPQDRPRAAELTRTAEGLEFRVTEVKRGTKMVDPGLTAFGIPESSVPPTAADPGQELILVSMEARRTKESARLPVRKMFLVDASGRLYENHSAGDNPFGAKPLERRQYMFKVPAGMRPVKLKFELGTVLLDLPDEKKA